METKKFIKSGILFSAIFVATYFFTIFLFCKIKVKAKPLLCFTANIYSTKGGNTYQKFMEFDSKKKYDILIIGSSHAYRSFDPRIFKKNNLEIFTLGTSGQAPINTFQIAKEYISSSNCKMVILDLFDGVSMGDGFESSADLIENVKSNKVAIALAFSYTNPQTINMLVKRFIDAKSNDIYKDNSYVESGFSQKQDSLIYSLPEEEYVNSGLPSEKQIHYLEKIIDYLKSQHIAIALVTAPYPKEKDVNKHNMFAKLFYGLAIKYNLKYYDYAFNHKLNSLRHFYDDNHLNQLGVELFDRALLNDIKGLN